LQSICSYLLCAGKVDKKKLLAMTEAIASSQSIWPDCTLEASESSFENVISSVRSKLWELWKNGIGLSLVCCKEDTNLTKQTFLTAGGTSLAAVEFAECIEKTVLRGKTDVQNLLDIILHHSFTDLEAYVIKRMTGKGLEAVKDLETGSSLEIDKSSAKIARLSKGHSTTGEPDCEHIDQSFWAYLRRGSLLQSLYTAHTNRDTNRDISECTATGTIWNLGLSLLWKVNTGKCVDASPLIAMGNRSFVFIGSHSYLFMAVDINSGVVVWKTRLPERIESSATLSACGSYVAVGCYDGCLYVYEVQCGHLHWTFQTGDVVKSSPCTDPFTGHIWFGSHDHHVYAVNVKDRNCVAKLHCGGGSCFASPAIDNVTHQLYTATLSGCVIAIDLIRNSVAWTYDCPKPIFSSPCVASEHHVCIGCVDGFVYCVADSGTLIWKYNTGSPVFSSPCVTTVLRSKMGERNGWCHKCDEQKEGMCEVILIASHSCKGYCLCCHGQLMWCCDADSPIYATPFAFQASCTCIGSDTPEDLSFGCFVSSKGTVFIVSFADGTILTQYKLPGEVFSSPVIKDSTVFVGCRDDYLYALGIAY
jgi:acyl-CoA synthetase